MKTKILAIVLLLGSASAANALVDVRIGYGMNTGSPSSINNYLTGIIPGANTFKSLTGITADAVVKLPLFPIGFGLRYETLSDSKSTNFASSTAALDTKIKFDRVALLLNYRVIDTLAYFGAIATYGVVNSSTLTFNCPGCAPPTSSSGKADSASSYSVGLEGGAKLASFRAGAEVGYSSLVAKDYKYNGVTALDDSGAPLKVDMTGMYAKVLIGLGF